MTKQITRRSMFRTAGIAALGGVAAQSTAAAQDSAAVPEKVLILGVSCSPRKGKTTATAIGVALEAAKSVDSRLETELIDLGGLDIAGSNGETSSGAGEVPLDDFQLILPSFQAPNLGGIIIGSPTYFRSLSALCKAFLERLAILREPKLLLANKPVGALAVGAYRNGGQELVIEQILTAMLCHEVMAVGGKPRAHQGATLWNSEKDNIMKDQLGIESAKQLGIRVAEAALKLAGR